MSRRTINEQTTLPELAALVSEALEKAGITATLSGGAAVSIYSANRYVSEDLDFVTIALVDELKTAPEPSTNATISIGRRCLYGFGGKGWLTTRRSRSSTRKRGRSCHGKPLAKRPASGGNYRIVDPASAVPPTNRQPTPSPP